MARLFDDASTHYLEHAAAVVTSYPFSLAARFKSDDTATAQLIVSLTISSGTFGRFGLAARGDVAGDPLNAYAEDLAGSNASASTSSGYTSGQWYHGLAVFTSNTSRAVYIDGGSKGTNTTSRTVQAWDRTSVGRFGDSTPSAYLSGDIAEAAIWNVALDDTDAILLGGLHYSPQVIRPANLVAYWRILGRHAPEIDPYGRYDLTVSGATQSTHPRVQYGLPALAQAPGALDAVPRCWSQYRRRHG